ncbi:hypothetical protein ANCCAN_16680, partial [Ancylostoma caninum]
APKTFYRWLPRNHGRCSNNLPTTRAWWFYVWLASTGDLPGACHRLIVVRIRAVQIRPRVFFDEVDVVTATVVCLITRTNIVSKHI